MLSRCRHEDPTMGLRELRTWRRSGSVAVLHRTNRSAKPIRPRQSVKVITSHDPSSNYVCDIATRQLTDANPILARSAAGTLGSSAGSTADDPAAYASTEYLSRPDVRSFIEALQAEHGLDPVELERVLGDAQYQPSVVRLIGPDPLPATQGIPSYPAYRSRFLTTSRIRAGTRYWEMYDAFLRRAEQEFGVPPEVILGIIGVETAFGQNTGSFRVVDSLATIAFDGPRRQEYFRDELKELLLLAREMSIDPLTLKGSYAGAMGLPQFMPSSYRRYAIDFDGDGVVISLAAQPTRSAASQAIFVRTAGLLVSCRWCRCSCLRAGKRNWSRA